MLHYIHQRAAHFAVWCRAELEFSVGNSCLLQLEMTKMRAVRVNQSWGPRNQNNKMKEAIKFFSAEGELQSQ